MKKTTMSKDQTRLAFGGLLLAASAAIGAGSDAMTPDTFVDAPLIAPLDARPPAATVLPAAERDARGHGVAPRDDVAAPTQPAGEVIKEAAVVPAPAAEALLVLEGSASWYSDALAGRRTASGEPYDPRELIAAHRALPFGTRVRVTNLANERSVEVRVIDRGPFIAGRIIDLSRSAAEEIGIIRAGHGRVRVEVLEYGG